MGRCRTEHILSEADKVRDLLREIGRPGWPSWKTVDVVRGDVTDSRGPERAV